jgi:hypothetical protein
MTASFHMLTLCIRLKVSLIKNKEIKAKKFSFRDEVEFEEVELEELDPE